MKISQSLQADSKQAYQFQLFITWKWMDALRRVVSTHENDIQSRDNSYRLSISIIVQVSIEHSCSNLMQKFKIRLTYEVVLQAEYPDLIVK